MSHLLKRSIQALPVRVFHARIEPEDLEKCAWPLMKLFLQPEKASFFHFTSTGSEISLILCEDALQLFAPNTLTIASSPWRGLSLSGSLNSGSSVCSYVSAIVARAKVSMYYLSTAQNDLIFVQEHDFDSAVAALKEHFQFTFISHDLPPPTVDLTRIQQKLRKSQSSGEIVMFKFRPNLECKLLPNDVQICSLSKEHRPQFTQFILSQVFFTHTCPFFSFTETEDEISLLLESEVIETLLTEAQRSLLSCSEEYRPLQRFEKLSLGEVGVISTLSKLLAHAKVPLCYLSTYRSAYLLVPSTTVNFTKLSLESAGYGVKVLGDTLSDAGNIQIAKEPDAHVEDKSHHHHHHHHVRQDGKTVKIEVKLNEDKQRQNAIGNNTSKSQPSKVSKRSKALRTKLGLGRSGGPIPDEYNVSMMLQFPDYSDDNSDTEEYH